MSRVLLIINGKNINLEIHPTLNWNIYFISHTGYLFQIYDIPFNRADKERLWDNDKCFNDTLVDFGMRILKEAFNKKDYEDVYLFSGLMVQRIKESKFESFSKATRLEIFSKNTWILPFCSNNHWIVLIFQNMRQNEVSILVFDSKKDIGVDTSELCKAVKE